MSHEAGGSILRQLRRLIGRQQPDEAGDGELLERFTSVGDEAAFETLIQRHGGMIMGVCQRVLGNRHDAEDAFQATFLVLMRSGHAVRRRGTVGHWLYVVAYRVALQARARAARRRLQESEAARMQPATVPEIQQDLREAIDAEVNRLPERYRAAIVLCYFEGKSNEEAARLLGWTRRSVTGRLARARELLQRRLAKRELALATAALAALTAPGSVSAALVENTIKAASLCAAGQAAAAGLASSPAFSLMEGALRAMWITRLKTAAVMLSVVLVLTGSGWLLQQTLADKPAEPATPAQAEPGQLPELPAAFAQSMELVKPRANEAQFATVPWAETLWDARVQAAATGKPIFIWVTGGPPGIC